MDTNACLDVAGHGDTHNDADRIHRDSHHAQTTASAAMPPLMAKANATSVDELVQEMNRIPLFMTTLDDSDGAGGENVELEALKALAYEGTRAEIAQNFRDQGTELVRYEKRYAEAREYYSKALQALQSPPPEPNPEQGPKVVEMDDEAETAKERAIREACLVNRALCHLEMSIASRDDKPPSPSPLLTSAPARKLRVLQPRLRRRPPAQPPQHQGLVPRGDGVSGARQARRGARCVSFGAGARRAERGAARAAHRVHAAPAPPRAARRGTQRTRAARPGGSGDAAA